MSRYTGPKCRRCRQVGDKLFLKGERCLKKCPLDAGKPYPPGQHGKGRFSKRSEFAKQLREKQKARYVFGLNEKQFRIMFEKADRKQGVTGDNFFQLLERRLDNVIYRSGLASSRDQARQYINHGLFKINGRRVTICSFLTRPGDKFEFTASAKKSAIFENLKNMKIRPPRWIKVDIKTGSGEIIDLPTREDFEKTLSSQPIVEFYSK